MKVLKTKITIPIMSQNLQDFKIEKCLQELEARKLRLKVKSHF